MKKSKEPTVLPDHPSYKATDFPALRALFFNDCPLELRSVDPPMVSRLRGLVQRILSLVIAVDESRSTVSRLTVKRRKRTTPKRPYPERVQFTAKHGRLECRVTIESILLPDEAS